MRRLFLGIMIGAGVALGISALVNLVSAVILLEPSDAGALGITRTEVVVWYGCVLIAGVLLVVLGVRMRGKN